MAQDVDAHEGPPQIPPTESGVAPKGGLAQGFESEGSSPKESRITEENLSDPEFQALLLQRYVEARQGGKDGMVSPAKIDMVVLEENVLREIEMKEQAAREQKLREQELERQAVEAGIPEEEKERGELNKTIEKVIWGDDRDGQEEKHRVRLVVLVEDVMPYKAEYRRIFGGTSIGNIPECIFEDYKFNMSDERNAPALHEVRAFADTASALRQELEKDSPNFQKVDALYSGFFYKRLEHFLETVNQRAEGIAQSIYDPGNPGITVESLRGLMNEDISKKQEYINARLEEVRNIVKGSGFKASRLAIIGNEVSERIFPGRGMKGAWVFYPDNFSTDPEQQKKAFLHEELTLKYRALQKSKAQAT